jgi:hypothetical protein
MNTGIIFGFDGDHEGVFEKTVDFLERNQIELGQFSVLTPLPGTCQLQHIHAVGRLTAMDWRHYDGVHCVFRPKQMTSEALEAGCHWAWHAYYSIPSIARRILKPGDKLLEIVTNMYYNWAYRRRVNHLPKGALDPLAKIVDRSQKEIAPCGSGTADGRHGDSPGLQIQLGRDHLRFTNTLEVHLEGVLDERTAYPLQECINPW